MNNEILTVLNFYKDGNGTSIVSVDINKLMNNLKKESKLKNSKLKFTFGLTEMKGNWNDEEKILEFKSARIFSIEKKKNKTNKKNKNNIKIIYIFKKEKKKIERKKYQERKTKEKDKKVECELNHQEKPKNQVKTKKNQLLESTGLDDTSTKPSVNKKNISKTNEKPTNPNIKSSSVGINSGFNDKKSKFYYERDDEFVESKKVKKLLDKNLTTKIVPIEKWTSNQFLNHLNKKFNQAYGYSSLEFGMFEGKRYYSQAKGKLFSIIKNKLLLVMKEYGINNQGIKNYVDWMYDIKALDLDFPITLNFLCSKGVMAEWIHKNKNMKKNKSTIKRINGGAKKKIHRPKK